MLEKLSNINVMKDLLWMGKQKFSANKMEDGVTINQSVNQFRAPYLPCNANS